MPSWKTLFTHKRPAVPEDYAHLNDGRYVKREQIIVQTNPIPIHINTLSKAHSSSSEHYDKERPRTSSSSSSPRYSPHAPRHRHQSGLSESHRSSSSTSVRFGDILYERPRTPSYSTTARYAKPPRSIMKPCPSLTSSRSDTFLHPLLVYPDAHLHYQLLQPPSPQSIFAGSFGQPIPEFELSEPATHPPTRSSIQIVNPHMPWTITVRHHRSSSTTKFYVDGTQAPDFVSVYDVLHAIHTSLAKPISRSDWDTLSPQKQKSVTRAYERRCKAMGEDQWERGVRRIDWLRRRIVFGGLVATSDGQTWEAVLLEVGGAGS